jgi:hypothetical protein
MTNKKSAKIIRKIKGRRKAVWQIMKNKKMKEESLRSSIWSPIQGSVPFL